MLFDIICSTCYIDDVVNAMMEPHMVLAKPRKMESDDDADDDDDGDDGDDEKDRIPVARLHSRNDSEGDLEWQFVEVRRNRVFWNPSSDVEYAYQEFIASLEEQKEKKTANFAAKRLREHEQMIFVMKCCLIAYMENEQESQLGKFDPQHIPNILQRNTHVLHSIMPVYFKTGMSLGVLVNNPKKVYDECVDFFSQNIRKAVVGERPLETKEDQVCSEALLFINGEK